MNRSSASPTRRSTAAIFSRFRIASAASNTQAEIRVTENDQAGANVDALLARSISFHFMENGVYENRQKSHRSRLTSRDWSADYSSVKPA